MDQSKKLIAESKAGGEKAEVVGELYSEEISHQNRDAQLAVQVPDCLKEQYQIPRAEIE